MSGIVRARVSPEWAEEVSTAWFQLWEYNRKATGKLTGEINVSQLGGLVITCSETTYTTDRALEIARRGTTINLAFDQPGRLTDTEWLIEAALTSERTKLVTQLKSRQKDTRLHGPSEGWMLPVNALELIGQSVLQAS